VEQKIAKAVAVIGVMVAIAACADGTVPTTTSLSPGSVELKKEPKAKGLDLPPGSKVTICHAAGLAGTTHYIRITLSVNGLNGHFGNNGTTKAGHELDFIETPEHLCNAPEAAHLIVCKLSSGLDPDAADPNASFDFTSPETDPFSLKFKQCTDPIDVVPGNVKITEAHDPNAPAAFSYFATNFTIDHGTLVNSSGFGGPPRPDVPTDAAVEVTTTSGNTTTLTFYNRN
jgi:hypothetical protein